MHRNLSKSILRKLRRAIYQSTCSNAFSAADGTYAGIVNTTLVDNFFASEGNTGSAEFDTHSDGDPSPYYLGDGNLWQAFDIIRY